MKKPVVANCIDKTATETRWMIQWPSRPNHWGKVYRATTFKGSELIIITTAAKRLKVAPKTEAKIYPEVRAALTRAGAFKEA